MLTLIKKAKVALVISDRANLRTSKADRLKGAFHMTGGLVPQEDV